MDLVSQHGHLSNPDRRNICPKGVLCVEPGGGRRCPIMSISGSEYSFGSGVAWSLRLLDLPETPSSTRPLTIALSVMVLLRNRLSTLRCLVEPFLAASSKALDSTPPKQAIRVHRVLFRTLRRGLAVYIPVLSWPGSSAPVFSSQNGVTDDPEWHRSREFCLDIRSRAMNRPTTALLLHHPQLKQPSLNNPFTTSSLRVLFDIWFD